MPERVDVLQDGKSCLHDKSNYNIQRLGEQVQNKGPEAEHAFQGVPPSCLQRLIIL